jgi:hypothetical protein
MAGRKPPRRDPRRRPVGPPRRTEAGRDGFDYEVVTVPAARAVNGYRCPGCDHEIRAGVAHVVAWRADGDGEDRRHWHSACWANRANRSPTRRWS